MVWAVVVADITLPFLISYRALDAGFRSWEVVPSIFYLRDPCRQERRREHVRIEALFVDLDGASCLHPIELNNQAWIGVEG